MIIDNRRGVPNERYFKIFEFDLLFPKANDHDYPQDNSTLIINPVNYLEPINLTLK
jgi:hypothetical protein